MPGFTGIIGPASPPERAADVERMVAAMCHEAFYATGTLLDEGQQLAAGWAVHDGGFADGNPHWNATRDIALVLCGEDFVDSSELSALRARGRPVPTDDAGYILQLYEEYGPDFVLRLNGTCCGVVLDLRAGRVMLFNDRFGLNRIYLHESGGRLYFASEAKSLLRVVPATRRLDPAAIAEVLTCGCVLQNRSLFEGIALMPPASRLLFAAGTSVRRDRYFDLSGWEQQERLPEAAYYEQLEATFSRIVPKYFRGRQKVAMSLTGGLDGRMIMASSGRGPGTVPCYTFGGSYRDCTDVTYARRIARSCGQAHQVITVDGGFLPQFAQLAAASVYISDGAMDVTGAVELYVNREARRIAPVRLTGNYGSEILRSNVAFRAHPFDATLFDPQIRQLGDAAAATYDTEARVHRLSLITAKQVPWHHPSRLAVEQSQLTMRSPYLDNDLVALAYRAPAGEETSKVPALRFIAEKSPKIAEIPTDRGLTYPPRPVVTRLQNLYQEATFRAEYAYDYGMPQWLARVDHALRGLHLERVFLGRHKFYHFRVWYRDKLRRTLEEMLLDPRSLARPYLSAARLREIVGQHVAGTHNHTNTLHQALSLELISRTLIESA